MELGNFDAHAAYDALPLPDLGTVDLEDGGDAVVDVVVDLTTEGILEGASVDADLCPYSASPDYDDTTDRCSRSFRAGGPFRPMYFKID